MSPQHRTTFNRVISIATAFIVFGFIDNFLMIMFGEQIDSFFRSMGVSNTLLAAGLGNTFSDAIGILSGRWVEKLVHLKLPPVVDGDLSRTQTVAAETIGIIIGCLIGLLPLLFF